MGVPKDIKLPGWVPISLPNFNPHGLGTIAAEPPVALGPATGHLGEVWDLVCPHIFMGPFNFCFMKFLQKHILWAVQTLRPHF